MWSRLAKGLSFILLGLALASSICSTGTSASENDRSIHTSYGTRIDPGQPSVDPRIARSRLLELREDLREIGDPHPGDSFRFELFDGVRLLARVESRIERAETCYGCRGTIESPSRGRFAFAVHQDHLAGDIEIPGIGLYEIRSDAFGSQILCEIETTAGLRCGAMQQDGTPQPSSKLCPTLRREGLDDGSIFDVMIAYTAAARQGAGGTAPMQAQIDLAVDQANYAYQTSEIPIQLRLVQTIEVDYTESGSCRTDLDRLTQPYDGYLDELHAIRDSCKADLVSLYTETGSLGGLAHIMSDLSHDFEVKAFSIVRRPNSSWVLAHELGHNMGCRHDRENADHEGLYDFSYGWRFVGNTGTQWRTIMAYSPGVWIQQFSNPDVLFDGQPTGVPAGEPNESDNALTIRNAAYTIANWRPSEPPRDTLLVQPDGTGPYPTIRDAVDASVYGDVVALADGTYTGPNNRDISTSKKITICSIGGVPENCVIDCQHQSPGISFGSGTTDQTILEGIRIDGGFGAVGAGLCCQWSGAVIRNCIFSNCEAAFRGGGAYCWSAPVKISQCLFFGNTAQEGSGLSCLMSIGPSIESCTFAGNQVTDPSGGVLAFNEGAASTIRHSIVALNANGPAVVCDEDAVPEIECSDIFGNSGGDWTDWIAGLEELNENLHVDPLFCDLDRQDIRLREDSPCGSENNPICGLIGGRATGCPPRACCVGDSCIAVNDADCNALGGQWLVEYETCETDPCSFYACCVGSVCQLLDRPGCDAIGGERLVGIEACDPSPCVPENDVCSAAIAIDPCSSGQLVGDTRYANDDYSGVEDCTGREQSGGDVVYSIEVVNATQFDFVYTQFEADGSIYLVTHCANPGGSCVAGVDQTGFGEPESLSFMAGAYTHYYLILDSYGWGTGGPWTLDYVIDCTAAEVGGENSAVADIDIVSPSPNPWTANTTIEYRLPANDEAWPVRLEIFDISGRLVKRLVDRRTSEGFHRITWDGTSLDGVEASSGVYFCRLTVDGRQVTRRMIRVR